MRTVDYFRSAAAISLFGALFAGYLSGYKLFANVCAFNESCPYVLGYPACWYGLAMFAAMLAMSIAGLRSRADPRSLIRANAIVSFVGILFSGVLVLRELEPVLLGGPASFALGLPTCAYGLVAYVVIFVLSAGILSAGRPRRNNPAI